MSSHKAKNMVQIVDVVPSTAVVKKFYELSRSLPSTNGA